MMSNTIICPDGLSQVEQDLFWMQKAFELAKRSEAEGEVPVGAVVVLGNQLLAEGWNRPIQNHDPTAHAEIMALQAAGQKLKNYRLIDTTLYVTLEPCPMCASAMVHARVAKVVYAADDLKTGAATSAFRLLDSTQLNHQVEIVSGVMQQPCSELLSHFFKKRRDSKKKLKKDQQQITQKNPIKAC